MGAAKRMGASATVGGGARTGTGAGMYTSLRGSAETSLKPAASSSAIVLDDQPVNATGIVVAPRLRATGLPCIASRETMSSGNTQHLGTENNRFIDASGTRFILQQGARPRAHTVRLNNMYII